jgi:hypothetical protein
MKNIDLLQHLPTDKIKINWNRKPIRMDLFLSFLKVDLERSTDHLGSCNGWTRLENKELKLVVSGGGVGGVEYLDRLEFGTRLNNSYNNFVSPFYLFGIMADDGKRFFIDYYKVDIDALVKKENNKVGFLKQQLKEQKEIYANILSDVKSLRNIQAIASTTIEK